MYILGQECREGSQKEMFNPFHWAELLGLSDLQSESLEQMVKIEKAFGKCECIFEQIARRVHPCSVAQLCLTLCNPIDCNPPDSSVHGISQAKILECVAISSSRGSSWPSDQTHASYISCIGRGFFTNASPGKNHNQCHKHTHYLQNVLWTFLFWR